MGDVATNAAVFALREESIVGLRNECLQRGQRFLSPRHPYPSGLETSNVSTP